MFTMLYRVFCAIWQNYIHICSSKTIENKRYVIRQNEKVPIEFWRFYVYLYFSKVNYKCFYIAIDAKRSFYFLHIKNEYLLLNKHIDRNWLIYKIFELLFRKTSRMKNKERYIAVAVQLCLYLYVSVSFSYNYFYKIKIKIYLQLINLMSFTWINLYTYVCTYIHIFLIFMVSTMY